MGERCFYNLNVLYCSAFWFFSLVFRISCKSLSILRMYRTVTSVLMTLFNRNRNVAATVGGQHPLPASAGPAANANGSTIDGMVVFHMTDDGNSECYVQRGQTVAELKSAAAAEGQRSASAGHGMGGGESGRQVQGSNVTELLQTVEKLQADLANAYRRINELQQQNNLLRQMHEAQVPMR